MSFIDRLKSPQGVILVSIILGLGLSCLFRQVCHGRNCIVYRPPPLSSLLGKYFKFGNECYQYSVEVIPCTGNEIQAKVE